MTKPELGLKRRCMTCGAKFYDLNRSPITCPKCGTPFQAAPLTRAPAPAAGRARDEEEPEAEAAGPELVSLEDSGADAATEDVSLDDINTGDDATDDTVITQGVERGDRQWSGRDRVSGPVHQHDPMGSGSHGLCDFR